MKMRIHKSVGDSYPLVVFLNKKTCRHNIEKLIQREKEPLIKEPKQLTAPSSTSVIRVLH